MKKTLWERLNLWYWKTFKQRTFCFCPNCKNELISSDSFVHDKELVRFNCSKCGIVSDWNFDSIAPILVHDGMTSNLPVFDPSHT